MRGWGLALVVAALVACAPAERGPGVDTDAVVRHVAALTELGPRPGDTEAARAAAAYIEAQLPGLVAREPVGDVALPEIRVLGTVHRAAHVKRSDDPNLVVRLGPREGRALLVLAHYDTVPGSPGAIDNAAAVGVLIELARLLERSPPAQPVWLAFTAAEEEGLVGAEVLAARHGDEIALAIALDLVGGDGPLSLNGASTAIGEAELGWLADAADRAGVLVRAPLAHRVISRWWPQAERSDHGPFTRRGGRAFHLYHRGHDGEWIDLAYHSDRDRPERVVRGSVDELGRLLVAAAATPVPPPGGDGFWLPVAANTVVPRAWLVALELVLAALALAFPILLAVRRREREVGGLGLLVGGACFALVAIALFALERLAAGTHPIPWIHAPGRWLAGELLVGTGGLVLASRLCARFAPWRGTERYLVAAIATPLALGLALLALGAAELAWIWLVPAALLAVAPRVDRGRARPLALVPVASTLLPVALVLRPAQLREAAWNGFLPFEVPLAAWLAVVALPVAASVAWYARTRRPVGPLGAFAVAAAGLAAVVIGAVLIATGEPACASAELAELRLACEQLR